MNKIVEIIVFDDGNDEFKDCVNQMENNKRNV